MESWRFKMEPSTACGLVFADSHPFAEEQEPDPDTQSEKPDPDYQTQVPAVAYNLL